MCDELESAVFESVLAKTFSIPASMRPQKNPFRYIYGSLIRMTTHARRKPTEPMIGSRFPSTDTVF